MKIVKVTTSYPRWLGDPSGSFVHELAAEIVREGHQVVVVTLLSAGAVRQELMDGVEVHRIGKGLGSMASEPGGILPGLRRRPWRIVRLIGDLLRLATFTRSIASSASVIHGHWAYPGGLIASGVAKLTRVPSVVTLHGGDVNLTLRFPPFRPLFRAALRGATVVTAVSDAMREAAIGLGAASDVDVVRLGVREPARLLVGENRRDSDALHVLFVGSLTPRKGVDVLLDAIQLVRRRISVRLSMIGDGPLASHLATRNASEALDGTVSLLGPLTPSEVGGALAGADVLVLPSRSEGLGLVCVEAMMASLPVVASDIPGPRELIVHGVTGFLCPPGNASAFADAIVRLAEQRNCRLDMGRAGRRRAETMGLTLSEAARRYLNLYHSIS